MCLAFIEVVDFSSLSYSVIDLGVLFGCLLRRILTCIHVKAIL